MIFLGERRNGLEILRLSKAYRGRTVLDRVDLEVDRGSILAVTGSNGSGKSTLLRCVAGLASCTGVVLFDGEPIATVRDRVGYLPQVPGLHAWASGAEVMSYFGRLRGVEDPMAFVPDGFFPDPSSRIGVLSGGQRQRVALAIALLGGPSLLLLDEPSANLDDNARDTLWSLLRAAAEGGATVLVATPKDADMGPLADRTVRIVDGVLTESTAVTRGDRSLVVCGHLNGGAR
ncbi:MAG TPA: ABC transporter ATP-binding protein [Acidimicrobiia bacterium]|nr:ABC transporter ATP-binding protein [Acidimicrobiia bacterium]